MVAHLDGEVAVKVGHSAIGGALLHDGGADDRFAAAVFHTSRNDRLRMGPDDWKYKEYRCHQR